MVCVECRGVVREFLLENCLGETVWPPSDEEIARIPEQKPIERVRRKPTEAEPRGFRVILPYRRG